MTSSIEDLTLQDGKVLVYQDVVVAREEVSPSGLVTKLAVGPNTKASSGVVVVAAYGTDITVGSRVIFSPYSGFAMAFKGDGRYLLLGDHEIFAYYEGEVGDVEIR